MTFRLVLTGDSILNRQVSSIKREEFLSLVDRVQKADCAITHFESTIHDYSGPELYPAAEAGWTWMSSPEETSNELAWIGFDAATLASNHSLDYSYGGLRSTIRSLAKAGLKVAGTGEALSLAAAPAYIDGPKARVGLLSATSSYQPWSRAGDGRHDMHGRPGVNPLRYSYTAEEPVIDKLLTHWEAMGYWVTEVDDGEWWSNPPGLHNSTVKFFVGDSPFLTTTVDPLELQRHTTSAVAAKAKCDVLVVQLHNHEWNAQTGLHDPARFATEYARAMIDAGADIVLAEGSHAALRGIEVYRGKVILYDPGDFFRMGSTVSRLPQDFYDRHHHELADPSRATVNEGWHARTSNRYHNPRNPTGGYRSGRANGGFLVECEFADDLDLERIELLPIVWSTGKAHEQGVPLSATTDEATRLLDYMSELSRPFGTTIGQTANVGHVIIH